MNDEIKKGPTPENPTPGLSQEIKQKGEAVMPAIELSIGAHEGSIVIDWGQPRAWIALPPEGVPSFISAVVSAAIEAQKQIREAEFLAKREAEKKAQEQVVSDQW